MKQIVVLLSVVLLVVVVAVAGDFRYDAQRTISEYLFDSGRTRAQVDSLLDLPRLQTYFDWDKMELKSGPRVIVSPNLKTAVVVTVGDDHCIAVTEILYNYEGTKK